MTTGLQILYEMMTGRKYEMSRAQGRQRFRYDDDKATSASDTK